ncbi:DnaJ C-terminal domain-containing protein [Trinickia sp. LjRoot230]|uniref:DnaJ C-terminal domain-containing protein n=1 Tax=Trinickia sp. LjRoot230 TaxID=3342288 RepID=UPI003F4F874E
MSLDQYYERLDLPSTASQTEIKRAYRRLRAKYHPDRNKGDESAVEPVFKRVQEAFEILTGQREAPASPRQSDTQPTRTPAQESRRATSQPSPGPWSNNYRSTAAPLPIRGANRHTQLHVPLDIAINGGQVLASYQVSETCRHCGGTAGQARLKTTHWCTKCQGKGFEPQLRSEPVSVPCGAWDGQRIVVPGGGFAGLHGGGAGDATFTVVVICGPGFQRDGLHLAGELEVDFVTATLGGAVDANVLLGRDLHIAIAANAQPGSIIRLPRHGLADASGNRGELRLRIVLVMPKAATHLTDEERLRFHELFAGAARRARNARS